MNPNSYVEQREDGWYVRESRVSVDSLIYAFRDGLSAEAIARECFSALSLEQVYGAITFYLANRAELDAQLRTWQTKGEIWRQAQRTSEPDFARKMAQARRELLAAS